MSKVRQFADFAAKKTMLGLGEAKLVLCRRGLDLSQEFIELSIPVDGEDVSDDGSVVYLSGRTTEQ